MLFIEHPIIIGIIIEMFSVSLKSHSKSNIKYYVKNFILKHYLFYYLLLITIQLQITF